MKNIVKAICPACYRAWASSKMIESANEMIEQLKESGEGDRTLEEFFVEYAGVDTAQFDGNVPFPYLCPDCQAGRDRGDVFLAPQETEGISQMMMMRRLAKHLGMPERSGTHSMLDLWYGDNRVRCCIQLTREQFIEYMDKRGDNKHIMELKEAMLEADDLGVLPQTVEELVKAGVWDEDNHGDHLAKLMTRRREEQQKSGGK